jgi:hypothetical protein
MCSFKNNTIRINPSLSALFHVYPLRIDSYGSLCTLILPKHETSNLYTLPRPTTIHLRLERRVRRPPRPAIDLRVKALDQQSLIWLHITRIIPLMRRIVRDIENFEARTPRYFAARALRW